jgi:hypothetical protein
VTTALETDCTFAVTGQINSHRNESKNPDRILKQRASNHLREIKILIDLVEVEQMLRVIG